MKKSKKTVITFKQAVEATPDVTNGFKTGLTALGTHSSKVFVSDTHSIQGSLDIDKCTKAKYPTENRWDYAFAYKGEVFFIEPHTANSGQVSKVQKKLQWLKNWLNHEAPEINKLKAKSTHPFYWIQSNKFAIPKTSPYYRAAVAAGLKPIPRLVLN